MALSASDFEIRICHRSSRRRVIAVALLKKTKMRPPEEHVEQLAFSSKMYRGG
jgi:hypothetical protein